MAWLRDTMHVDIDERTGRHYELNALAAHAICQNHDFFKSLDEALAAIHRQYEAATGSTLFSEPEPHLVLKTAVRVSAEQVVSAERRPQQAVPRSAKTGWVVPEHWFDLFDDIVRGELVCRYIDGPEPRVPRPIR